MRWRSGLVCSAACLLAAWSSLFVPGNASAAAPTLSHLFPAGGQRGSTVVTRCTGSFTWPVKVWSPGVDVVVDKEAGKLAVTIPSDLAADRVWIRLYNAEGVSAAMPFLIGSLKEINEQEPNHSLRNAQAIADANVTVNGLLQEGGDVDGFAVPLAAGQTLVAAVDANSRLGSPMDAILQLLSTEGTVLAENHDDVGLDPRLAYTATQGGTYLVRIFAFPSAPDTTIAFRGGPNYLYRLTMTTGAFMTHAVPLSVPQTDLGTVEAFGWNIPPNTRLPVVAFGGSRLGENREFELLGDTRTTAESQLGFAFAPQLAGSARIRLTPHAVVAGVAESDAKNPLTLVPPIAVTGWLRRPRQTDLFRVPLKKGQQVVIAVESNGLDLPLHLIVKLADPAGAVAAAFEDPAPPKDAVLTHTAAQDGEYRLTVGDRYRQGGERCMYRLTVRIQEPDFELSASADSLVVTADKPTELTLTVQRRMPPDGSVGPIAVEAIGLPPGVTDAPVVSEPTGPTATKVSLKFSSTGAAFSGPIRIVGTAVQPAEMKRFARTPPNFAASFETIWLTAVAKP